jgi:GDP-L-fucose synthase
MDNDSKIFVAGHNGLVGSAIVRNLESNGHTNIITRTRDELNLTDAVAVKKFFMEEKPEYVFLAAAKVGGIGGNSDYPADFIYQNLMIQSNVIHSAYIFGVKKLVFLGSSCIYPKFAKIPITEDQLLTGSLEPSNDSYAIAKIAGIKMCQAYRKQFGFNAVAVMPTNLYGPNDNFDHNYGHVLPSLIAKFHGSKEKSEHWVVKLWGDGSPKREFLHVDDLSEALYIIMDRYDDEEIINVGTGEDITIKELAEMIVEVTGYKNEYEWDTSKPNGTLRKVLDVDKIKSLGWEPEIGLKEGLESTYEWYKKSIGYEEVIHKISPFRRFLDWMDK